jgi:hypothetical protein
VFSRLSPNTQCRPTESNRVLLGFNETWQPPTPERPETTPSTVPSAITPTRTRTWIACLEDKHDLPFHHRGNNSLQWPRLDLNQRPSPCQGDEHSAAPRDRHFLEIGPAGIGPAGVEPASHRVSGGCLAARSTARTEHTVGVEPTLSSVAGWCLVPIGHVRVVDPARMEGFEPSACGLEPHYSPRSTPLSYSSPAGA